MGRTSYPKARTLTLAQQRAGITSSFPGFRYTGDHRVGVWVGTLRPGDECDFYTVGIRYKPGSRPVITVLSPKLRKRGGLQKIPHVYPGDHPCVYFPKTGEWHAGKHIGATIIPWLSMWLYFYEVWLTTGVWFGGGIEHGSEGKI